MKTLFVLIFISGGSEYTVIKNLTLEHCVARLIMERQALFHVQEKYPEYKANLECRPQ